DAGVTPAPWTARETELVHGRRHRWLLPELVGLSGGGVDVTALVGTWHTGELEVVFAADGRVRVGPEVGFWRARGDDLTLTVAGGAEAELRWRREARVLVLTGPLVGGTLVLEEGPRPDGAAAAARADVLAGRLADAHLRLAALRAQGVPEADGIARALAAIEGRAEAGAELPFAAESIAGGALARFEDDLRVFVATCRRYGAEVVLLGHAGGLGSVDAVQRRVAAALDLRYVDVEALLAASGEPLEVLVREEGYPTAGG